MPAFFIPQKGVKHKRMDNPAEQLVIVQWSTWLQAEPSFNAQPLEASLMYNAIAQQLRD